MPRARFAPLLVSLVTLVEPEAVRARSQTERSLGLERKAEEAMGSGHPSLALQYLETLRRRFAHELDAEDLARVELRRVDALRSLAERDRAGAAARSALEHARTARSPRLEASAYLKLATLARDAGAFEEQRRLLERALPLLEDDPALLAGALAQKARNLTDSGRPQDAVRAYGAALETAAEAGEVALEIRVLASRSSSLLALARYDEALDDAQRGFDLARNCAPPNLRASATFALAQVQAHLWNLERAAELWAEAIDAYREAGLLIGVALARRQSVETLFALGELDRAAEEGRAALALVARTGAQGSEADLLARLALIEARRGMHAESAELAARAEKQSPRSGPRRRYVEQDLGLVALVLGERERARARFEGVLETSRAQGDEEYEWRALDGLGRVALAEDDPARAQEHLEAAVTIIERLRESLPEAGLRASLLSGRTDAYRLLVRALMARRRQPGDRFVERAFEVAEQTRARATSDAAAEIHGESVRPPGASSRRLVSARVSKLQRRILEASSPAERSRLHDELNQAERELESRIVRERRAVAASAGDDLHPSSTRRIAEALRSNEALLSFSLDEELGFAWVLRSDRSIDSYEIPGRKPLAARVRLLHGLAKAGDSRGVRELGEELHRDLLEPARGSLAGVDRLLLAVEGPLFRLPFGLLRSTEGRWLIEDYAIMRIPSARFLLELRLHPVRAAPRPLLALAASGLDAELGEVERLYGTGAFGRARLEHADAEAAEVAELLGRGSDVRTGASAGEDAVKRSGLGDYRVLHFATHALLDELVPRRSALLLGAASPEEDGLLQLDEIRRLPLRAELVTLASCRSYVGREIRGEGLVSLSRAFLAAGARSVLSTLWPVEDAETRFLMRRFYDAMSRGRSPVDALREAQLASLQTSGGDAGNWGWAGFVLAGDAAEPVVVPRPTLRGLWTFPLVAGLAVVWLARRRRRPALSPLRSGS